MSCTADRSYNLPRSDVHKQRVAREGGVYTGGDGFVWEAGWHRRERLRVGEGSVEITVTGGRALERPTGDWRPLSPLGRAQPCALFSLVSPLQP